MRLSKHIPAPEHAKINQFAIRCFRDTGDADYIAARLAIRSGLAQPFLWSAEQAVEKYIKCILMLNRRTTEGLLHKIGDALERVNSTLPFKIELDKHEAKIFQHLVSWNADRYLLHSFTLHSVEVLHLDKLVWKLRQYCEPLDVLHYADTPSEVVLLQNTSRIEAGLTGPSRDGRIAGGYLEKVLENRQHPAREGLVWQNFYFTHAFRKRVMFRESMQATNAPLFIYPELADEVAKWMQIPKRILDGARQLARVRAAEKKNR